MIEVRFLDAAGESPRYAIPEMTDEAIEAALVLAEADRGAPYALDWRTDFPSFDVLEDGEVVGGG